MRRTFQIALGALCGAAVLSPGGARAQFRTTPMVVPAPATESTVIAQPFNAPGTTDADILVMNPVSSTGAVLRAHHALTSATQWTPLIMPFSWARAGRLAPVSGDAVPDVAYCSKASGTSPPEMRIGFGPAWTQAYVYATAPLNLVQPPTLSFVHLLARDADFIVMPQATGGFFSPDTLWALDFDPSSKAMSTRSWPVPARTRRMASSDEFLPMRLGANARAQGIDDLYMLGQGSVTIFENLSLPTATSLVGIDFANGVRVGGSLADVSVVDWLPVGVPNNDAQGAAPLDYYGHRDGTLDLLISLSSAVRLSTLPAGHLLAIRGTGVISDLAAATSWEDLNRHPDLMLSDPVVARPLTIGGEPAVAVWDRGLDQILVIRAGSVPGELRVWRGAALGHQVRDIFLADLVGSGAPDLVADATGLVPSGVAQPSPAVLVYPDLGDASPQVDWAPGSPGTLSRGEDHPMAVLASDPDGPFAVEWFVGDPWALTPPVAAATGSSYTLPGVGLCLPPPESVDLTVRATDQLGVWSEIHATLDVAVTPPRIAIDGASPANRLALAPTGAGTAARPSGGWSTTATFSGAAWTGCLVSLSWNAAAWPAGATVATDPPGSNPTHQTVVLSEAAYPDLLAGAAPVVSLTADDPVLGAPWTVTMPVAIDASGLAEIEQGSDLPTMGEGDVAVLRTRLRSQIGVALQGVRVIHALAGLAPAGPPRVSGANVLGTASGGTEVVLDQLPPAGAEVVVELPVRSAGDRHASAVEARSSGGYLLTPAAAVPAQSAPLPGCGCGQASGAGAAAALLVLLALARPRRRAPVP